MSKHTPGPWWHHLVRVQRDIVGPNGQSIAYTRGAEWSGDRDEVEDEANARLIAAAPALLEALQAVINSVPFHHSHKAAHDRALAAIAKATGSTT